MPLDVSMIGKLVGDRPWVLLWSFAIWFLLRMSKPDAKGPTLPAWSRWPTAIGLGLAGAAVDHLGSHTPWAPALDGGVASAVMALVMQASIVKTARKGRDVTLPKALKKNPPPPECLPAPERKTPVVSSLGEPTRSVHVFVPPEATPPPGGEGGGDQG